MMEMILVKLITLAGPPSVGKTSVILRLIEVLHKEKQKAGVIKFDCLTTFDKNHMKKRIYRYRLVYQENFVQTIFLSAILKKL